MICPIHIKRRQLFQERGRAVDAIDQQAGGWVGSCLVCECLANGLWEVVGACQ